MNVLNIFTKVLKMIKDTLFTNSKIGLKKLERSYSLPKYDDYFTENYNNLNIKLDSSTTTDIFFFLFLLMLMFLAGFALGFTYANRIL
jgi:hypothetical protein